jgi:hypothetical protein
MKDVLCADSSVPPDPDPSKHEDIFTDRVISVENGGAQTRPATDVIATVTPVLPGMQPI